MYSVQFLQTLAVRQRETGGDVKPFTCIYATISNKLVDNGVLSEFERIVMFLKGFPDGVVRKLVTPHNLSRDNPRAFRGTYEAVKKSAEDLCLAMIRAEEL